MTDARNEFVAPWARPRPGAWSSGGAPTTSPYTPTAQLYRARFEGAAPDVRTQDGTVRIDYPPTWHPLDWRRHSSDVALNAEVPWAVEVRGGASYIKADLGGLRLESFEIGGGANDVELVLPEPSGTVSIRIDGGINNLVVRRPDGVAARLSVGRAASKLVLDGQRLGAVGGGTTLESGSYSAAADRYEITITGGANDVSVGAA